MRSVIPLAALVFIAAAFINSCGWHLDVRAAEKQRFVKNELDVTDASFSPDGKYIVVSFARKMGSYHGPKWKMWDVETGKEIRTKWPNFDVHEKHENIFFISYLPGGKEILTQDVSGKCQIWDAEKVVAVREFKTDGGVRAVSKDGKKLLVSGFKPGPMGYDVGTVMVHESETGKRTFEMESNVLASHGDLSADCRWAVLASESTGSMSYIDLKERCIPYRWKNYHAMDGGEKTAETVRPLCFSPDGKTVLSQKAKGRMHRGAALCDVGTVKIKSEIPNVMRIISAAFTPDGTRLVLLDDSDRIEDPHPRQIYCWDMETKKEVWRKSASAYRAPSLQFDRIVVGPNGDVALLVNQTFPGGMALISTKTGERTSVFSTGGAFPESGNFSVPKTRQ